jgi:hypothetical protein
MNGLNHATAPYVFLTDADTIIPARDYDLGFLLAEIENGADAVGGIPSSNLRAGGLLPHIRATVKLPMIIAKRTFQQVLGGAPFLISGACGLFRTEVLREVGLSDRTKVEDLDLTWTLVERGYKCARAASASSIRRNVTRCARNGAGGRAGSADMPFACGFTGPLLFSRFGLFSMLPMFALVLLGLCTRPSPGRARFPANGPDRGRRASVSRLLGLLRAVSSERSARSTTARRAWW